MAKRPADTADKPARKAGRPTSPKPPRPRAAAKAKAAREAESQAAPPPPSEKPADALTPASRTPS